MRDRIRILAEGVVLRAASEAYAAACAAVPVDTGELLGSISVVCSGLSAVVVASAGHAAFVELGSASAPPRPFLLPALRSAQRRLSSIAGGVS